MTTTPGGHVIVDPEDELRPSEELHVALTTVAFFQSVIQQADTKAGILVVVHAGLTAALGTQAGLVQGARQAEGAVEALIFTPLAFFLIGFLTAGFHLVQVLRPRITPPPGPSRFAFPTVAVMPRPGRDGALRQCAEAHLLAKTLADIALVKYRHVGRAMAWLAFAFTTSLLWWISLAVAR